MMMAKVQNVLNPMETSASKLEADGWNKWRVANAHNCNTPTPIAHRRFCLWHQQPWWWGWCCWRWQPWYSWTTTTTTIEMTMTMMTTTEMPMKCKECPGAEVRLGCGECGWVPWLSCQPSSTRPTGPPWSCSWSWWSRLSSSWPWWPWSILMLWRLPSYKLKRMNIVYIQGHNQGHKGQEQDHYM